jgi:outer membrane protein TolC
MTSPQKNLFIFLFIFFLQNKGMAQLSIVPDLSDNYVEKLINVAKENYPKVKSYQNRINIASGNISKAKAGLLEALTVSYVYQPGTTTTIDPVNPSTSYFRGLQAGVFFNVGTFAEHPYLVKQSKQELLIAHNEQDEYLLNLATEVKKRYYVYVQRLAELKLQTKAVQDVESSLNDIRYKFEKGEETFENYNKTQTDHTNHQISKIQAESNLFIAKADLEDLLGTKLENVK